MPDLKREEEGGLCGVEAEAAGVVALPGEVVIYTLGHCSLAGGGGKTGRRRSWGEDLEEGGENEFDDVHECLDNPLQQHVAWLAYCVWLV